jgi:hypothetical protein
MKVIKGRREKDSENTSSLFLLPLPTFPLWLVGWRSFNTQSTYNQSRERFTSLRKTSQAEPTSKSKMGQMRIYSRTRQQSILLSHPNYSQCVMRDRLIFHREAAPTLKSTKKGVEQQFT